MLLPLPPFCNYVRWGETTEGPVSQRRAWGRQAGVFPEVPTQLWTYRRSHFSSLAHKWSALCTGTSGCV